MRRLLYHRDIDDSVGTYVSDYVVVVAVTPLCIYFLIKMCKMKTAPVWPPWNKSPISAPVTLMSYCVLAYSISMVLMALFAGVAHQTLQNVNMFFIILFMI